MRILHIATFLQGGAGRVIATLAAEQQRVGDDVCVAVDGGAYPGYATYPEYIDLLQAAGVRVLKLDSTFRRDRVLNVRAASTLRLETKGWRPDIVHAHAAIPGLVGRLAQGGTARLAPIVHTMHGWGIAKTPEQARTDVDMLRQADAVVTPSVAAGDTLVRLGLRPDDMVVIPYGIEEREPAASPDSADVAAIRALAAGSRTALCIGTIGERKNQRLLVEALARSGASDLVCVFIGDGDPTLLLQRAKDLNVSDRIAVLGHRPEASRYLSMADALVLPSRNEGLPLSVLEALRAGVPVATSDIPETIEALRDLGFLFARDDAASLAVALRRAIDVRGSEPFGAKMRALFQERYTLPLMTGAYRELYERIRYPRFTIGTAGRSVHAESTDVVA